MTFEDWVLIRNALANYYVAGTAAESGALIQRLSAVDQKIIAAGARDEEDKILSRAKEIAAARQEPSDDA